ncbi:hypothetical protein HY025_03740 [Candidatus Daviesbacteria bacterium]|nr:hypothetical protein [Candidatus Daviesbacteria bacterium]
MDEEIIDFIYKWHRFEKENDLTIIDFDLILEEKNYPGKFKDRKEAKKVLHDLYQKYRTQPKKDGFILAKLNSFVYFLNALEGEYINFEDYVENLVGIRPEIISDGEIKKQQNLCKKLLKQQGYSLTLEGLQKFTQDTTIPSKQLKDRFAHLEKEFGPKILNWLNLNFKLNYTKKIIDKDVYWYCYIHTDLQGKIILEFNINKRHIWRAGDLEILVLHELFSHAIQGSSWKEQIKKGRLDKVKGLTSVFTPEVFCQEGIGDTLWLFYPEQIYSDIAILNVNLGTLFRYVANNAYIMVNHGEDIEKCFQYIDQFLPGYRSKESIVKNLAEIKSHPLYRAYIYVYGIAEYYFRKIAEKLNDEQKRDFVLDIYQNFYTPKQILKKYYLP